MVLYENHLICIFMNIYENLKNDKKIIVRKKVINETRKVCGTVSSMLSGIETRSLGLNTLGTT